MSSLQERVIAITLLLSMLDGYDVLAMTFVAPALTRDWEIGKAALGGVLAAGLAGMAIGSLAIAPLADVFGRRKLVFAALGLMAIGSLLSAFSASLGQLAAWRVVTGLGVGACVAVISPLAAEFSNGRRRPLALALTALGYPAGGLIGGLLAAFLLHVADWRAVFLAGFVFAALLVPVVLIALPESFAFLIGGRRPDSLARLNALLMRCGQPALASLPDPAPRHMRGYRGVFAPEQRIATIRLAAINIFHAAAAYFVLSWLPQMVADAGFAPSAASLASAASSLTGIAGGLMLGAYAQRGGVKGLTIIAILCLAGAIVAFGVAPANLLALTMLAASCGFALFAGTAGLFSIIALSFPDAARASGTGFVVGVGRISSAVAPLLAGWLFSIGWGRAEVSLVFAICSVAAGALLLIHSIRRTLA
ncbi:MFS transporter [Sphingobium boeckii]|uniref:MFS family permease n=1 Tax=Sphingobium boeckii TaxID=1082345 RepID=A0A7W9AFV3_9SPHN|nr:MFS transporter [Sphingobium boeckii]MBB5684854.1 MFS family permease [Sphingobium boeckii]